MRVREAVLSDVVAMAHVIVDTFLASHQGQIPEEVWKWRQQNWTYEVSAQAWERTLHGIASGASPQECVYVAEAASGETVGLAMGGPDPEAAETTGDVYVLYVHPGHQRHGVGRRLVTAVAAHLAQVGMTRLTIDVLKANAPARRFYEALGGQVVGEWQKEEAGVLLPEVVYGWPDIRTLVSGASTGTFGYGTFNGTSR